MQRPQPRGAPIEESLNVPPATVDRVAVEIKRAQISLGDEDPGAGAPSAGQAAFQNDDELESRSFQNADLLRKTQALRDASGLSAEELEEAVRRYQKLGALERTLSRMQDRAQQGWELNSGFLVFLHGRVMSWLNRALAAAPSDAEFNALLSAFDEIFQVEEELDQLLAQKREQSGKVKGKLEAKLRTLTEKMDVDDIIGRLQRGEEVSQEDLRFLRDHRNQLKTERRGPGRG